MKIINDQSIHQRVFQIIIFARGKYSPSIPRRLLACRPSMKMRTGMWILRDQAFSEPRHQGQARSLYTVTEIYLLVVLQPPLFSFVR